MKLISKLISSIFLLCFSCSFVVAQTTTLNAPTGHSNYEWYKDGVVIPLEVSDSYVASVPGVYVASFEEDNCPKGSEIFVLADMCDPDPVTGKSVTLNLDLPDGDEIVTWSTTDVGNSITIEATRSPVQYTASVSADGGACITQTIFTVQGIDASCVVPITLTQFTAKAEGCKNLIMWETQSELNNDYFELQRSVDGVEFIQIAHVKGAGNSSEPIRYEYIDDRKIHFVEYYYRLVQHDFDKNTSKSEIIVVKSDCITNNNIVAYPNPTNDHVTIVYTSSDEETVSIEIKDLLGRTVLSVPYDLKEGHNSLEINTSTLEPSTYFITMVGLYTTSTPVKLRVIK